MPLCYNPGQTPAETETESYHMPEAVALQVKTGQKRMEESVSQNQVCFFLGLWLLLNLLQATFVELTSDEGYYWFYSRHLQWGYYDHPPVLAVVIRLGSYLFPGELGVRFVNVLLSTAGLGLFFTLLPGELRSKRNTFWVLLSAPLLNYLTILVFPDGPLLFLSLLFFVCYKRFLMKAHLSSSLWLGVALALMVYAKYHGALVLMLTLAANPRLLKSGGFYLSLFIAALLFLPHLWWQYQHGFPTLQYHLSGRTGSLSFRHIGEFVSQQILAIGPGLIFIPFVAKPKDVFERTLLFVVIGTFLFFLASSFKTFVHFHWTSIALFPLLYFAVAFYNHPQESKWLYGLILPFAILILIARLLLALPVRGLHAGVDYYHGRKLWAEDIRALAGGRPVFMPNNLREAPLYSFYSGRQGVALYTRQEKKSQFELWGYEDSLQGKEVLFVSKYPFKRSKELITSMKQRVYHAFLPSFRSYYSGIAIRATINQTAVDNVKAILQVRNHRGKAVSFDQQENEYTGIVYSIEQDNKIIKADVVQPLTSADNLQPQAVLVKTVTVRVHDLPKGDYKIYFGIRSGVLPDAILSTGSRVLKK